MSRTKVAPSLSEIIDQPCDCGGIEGCQSCEARRELRALLAVRREAFRYLHNSIPIADSHLGLRRALGLPTEKRPRSSPGRRGRPVRIGKQDLAYARSPRSEKEGR
jgi:hypothetical protein